MSSIKHREFGKTGLEVSNLALDVSRHPDLSLQEGVALLQRAFERGINLVALTTGHAEGEAIVAEALRQWREPVLVAARVKLDDSDGARALEAVETSLSRLGREQIDVLLLDGATTPQLGEGVLEALVEARQQGKAGQIGAWVPGVDHGLAAARHADIAVVVCAFSLVDQRAARGGGWAEAEATSTALLSCSPLFHGVLTSRCRAVPEQLSALTRVADRAERWASKHGDDLATGALRFCLSQDEIASVMVGVRSEAELETALVAAAAPSLPRHRLSDAAPLAVADAALLDALS